MHITRALAVALASMLLFTLSVQANDAADREPLTSDVFLRKAAMSGLAEVELGRLANTHGGSSNVREFGGQMVADHGKANERIGMLATTHGVQLPEQLDERHAATRERLQGLEGSSFDRAYADVMVENHRKSIELFERAADLPESDVAAFASGTLPTLRQHLAHAERLRASE